MEPLIGKRVGGGIWFMTNNFYFPVSELVADSFCGVEEDADSPEWEKDMGREVEDDKQTTENSSTSDMEFIKPPKYSSKGAKKKKQNLRGWQIQWPRR